MMMRVCLSHDTAFRWLMRNRNPRKRGLSSNARVLPLSSPSAQQCKALLSGLSLDDTALEVLVCRANGRRESECVKSHLSGVAYPAGSFVRVDVPGFSGVYAASPELAFRQIAAKRPLLEAVYVGYALCSSYRVDKHVDGGIAVREGDDAPLTSVERIGRYLRKTEGSYGCAKARRALSYVRDGSKSPAESALAMGLGLPLCMGGFAAGEVLLRDEPCMGGDDSEKVLVSPKRGVNVTMEEPCCGKRAVSMLVMGSGDGGGGGTRPNDRDKDAKKGCCLIDFPVRSTQVYEFASYVRLCEKICCQLERRDNLEAKAKGASIYDTRRREAIRARQADLWRTLVCFSSFRQAETGDCVKVFDPPDVRVGR